MCFTLGREKFPCSLLFLCSEREREEKWKEGRKMPGLVGERRKTRERNGNWVSTFFNDVKTLSFIRKRKLQTSIWRQWSNKAMPYILWHRRHACFFFSLASFSLYIYIYSFKLIFLYIFIWFRMHWQLSLGFCFLSTWGVLASSPFHL